MWILGSPRTGSTWLLEQLCDPLRLDDSRPLGFRPPARVTQTFDVLPVNEFLISSHLAPAFGEPVEVGDELLPATLNNYLGAKPAYLFARDFQDVWRPAVRQLVLARLHAVEARARQAGLSLAPAPLLVLKEVNGSHAADLVMSLFPRSRMLFLLRDGRDVIDSLGHALRQGGWLAEHQGRPRFDTAEERLEWLRGACRTWACDIDATRRAYAAHASALRLKVRYEDLVADPASTLAGLVRWLGLDWSTERLGRIVSRHAFSAVTGGGAGQKRRAATPGLWRHNLTDAEQEVAHEIMGRRLAELGYTA